MVSFPQDFGFQGFQTFCTTGIGTPGQPKITYTIPLTGYYYVNGKMTLPSINNGEGESALVVSINQNGAPKYSSEPGSSGFETQLVCNGDDLIEIFFVSAAAADQPDNVIKADIVIGLENI